jgi:hypothetical protein
MAAQPSPYEAQPPSGKRLALSVGIAIAGAALALVIFVLPAEYGIDPTGIGGALGLTAINGPSRTIEIADVVGGNEKYREVEIPEFGEPVPLPNPAVHQDEETPPQMRTLMVMIPPEKETEIKMVMREAKMIEYSWHTDRGTIYTDFHGHDPEAGSEYFVRYKEQQEGAGNNGSLAAPFAGEHGWYWLNYNDFPVVVTLTITGYFDDIVDYGIFGP